MRHPAAMQPIRRILVAIKKPDARSLPALNKAAQIAKGLGAQLTLFHDIATPLYAEALQGRDVDLKSWQREVQTARREQLEKLAARVRKHGIDVDVAADWDYPPYGPSSARRSASPPTCWWSRITTVAANIRRAGCWPTRTGSCCACVPSPCCW